MSEERLEPTQEEIENVKSWIKSQPHLPDMMSEILIRRFIHSCKYDLDYTKKTLELFFTIRSKAPEIFANRDPFAPEILNALEIADMCPLPNLSPQKYKVFLYRMKNNNPDLFDFNASVKAFLMLADARLNTELELSAGEAPVFDMAGISLRYVTKLVYSTLKKYMLYTQEAHPVRLKQIHIINTLSFVDKLFGIVKPLMKSELISMVHFHTPGSETLFEYIPKELLPEEYGGKAGTIEDIKQYWIQQVKDHKDYFMDEKLWKVDESKRLSNDIEVGEEVFGTFKTLSID